MARLDVFLCSVPAETTHSVKSLSGVVSVGIVFLFPHSCVFKRLSMLDQSMSKVKRGSFSLNNKWMEVDAMQGARESDFSLLLKRICSISKINCFKVLGWRRQM